MPSTFRKRKKKEDIPISCKFGDVSLAKLPRLPHQREIGYEIN